MATPPAAPLAGQASASATLPSCDLTATLVMESAGYAPQVRSHGVSRSWSRLYQHGELYIDLYFTPTRDAQMLKGQLLGDGLRAGIGAARLETATGNEAIDVDAGGHFSLVLADGDTVDLVLELPHGRLVVPELPIT